MPKTTKPEDVMADLGLPGPTPDMPEMTIQDTPVELPTDLTEAVVIPEVPTPDVSQPDAPLKRKVTHEPEAPAPEAPRPKRIELDAGDMTNPSMITFPTDRAGVTSKLKKEMIAAASRIGHDPEKMELVEETLRLLLAHMQARFDQACENNGEGLKPKVRH